MKNSNLTLMLKSPDPASRRDACEAIERERDVSFVKDLVGVLKDEDLGVKEGAINALTAIGGKPVAEAVVPLLRSENASLRNIGIEILTKVGLNASGTIRALLKDGDDDVVKFAVDTIAAIGDARFEQGDPAQQDISGLLTHKNPNVRASVAVCLGKINAKSAAPRLVAALKDDEEWVRFSVIVSLGILKEKAALGPIFELIERDSGLIKEAALEAIGKIAGPEDVPPLLHKAEILLERGQLLSASAVVDLFEKAFSSEARFTPSEEFKNTFFKFFSKVIDEQDKDAQFKAIKGLAHLKVPEGLSKIVTYANSLKEIDEDTEAFLVEAIVSFKDACPLTRLLAGEIENPRCRILKVIVKVLGAVRADEAVPLLNVLKNGATKDEIREIVAAFEAIGTKDAVDALFRLLLDNDGHTRKTSARALGRLAGPDAVGPLFHALRSEVYMDVMEEMTDVLASIPSQTVKDGFCALLKEPGEPLREMALRGLGHMGDEAVLPAIKEATVDKSPLIRQAAYRALAQIGLTSAIPEILKGLRDGDADVRLSVLKGFSPLRGLSGWVGDEIKAALVKALKDENIWVRYYAVLLLGDFPGAAIEKHIIEMLLSGEAPVKAAAAKSLEKTGSANAVRALERFKEHPDPAVRGAVEKALESLAC
ncbi:MAG: HEAT repeat domain-containing protein [Deltaproteobacteria bacterium]|nr:HEAT repeat domain-containing protein [Deltaproteobacteria bacterium]